MEFFLLVTIVLLSISLIIRWFRQNQLIKVSGSVSGSQDYLDSLGLTWLESLSMRIWVGGLAIAILCFIESIVNGRKYSSSAEEHKSDSELLSTHRTHGTSGSRLMALQRQPPPFNDPLFPLQWHLFNREKPGNDINVVPVWNEGILGTGVVVCIIDDGINPF